MKHFFNIFKKNEEELTLNQKMYRELSRMNLNESPWTTEDLGEDMTLVSESAYGWWKPRYVMDHRSSTAFEFLNQYECLAFATEDDIDWDSLKDIEEEAHERAESLDGHFPTWVSPYKNGVAQVRWQLNPDGRYYADEDGFGMTDDEELEIYGFIDRTGRVLVKFTHIRGDWDKLRRMRKEAEGLAGR